MMASEVPLLAQVRARFARSPGRSDAQGGRLSHLPATAAALAGPALIVVSVLVVLHLFAFGGLLSRQYPDVLPFWLPTYCFLGKAVAAGHLPLWNPHVMAGIPFAADPQSGWGSILAMGLFAGLPCATAMRWYIVIQPLLAGLGLYAFLRSEELSRPSATVGGLALAMPLAGSLLLLNLPFAATLAWTAVLLALTSRFVRARTWPSRLGWLAVAAVSWGQIAASNLSDGLVIGTTALAAYLLARLIGDVRRGARTRRQAWALVGLIALAFPSVTLAYTVPRLLYLPHTSIGLGYHGLYDLSKQLTGHKTYGLVYGSGTGDIWPLRLALAPGVYLGAAALVLAFGGWRATGRRALFVAFAAYGGFSYFFMIEHTVGLLPHWFLASSVGGFYLHDPSRFRFGLLLALAVCAALGFEGWRNATRWWERLLILAPGVVVWFVLPRVFKAGPAVELIDYGAGLASAALVVTWWKPKLAFVLPLLMAIELTANGLIGQAANYRYPAGSQPGDFLHGPINTLRYPTVPGSRYALTRPTAALLERLGGGRYISVDPGIWDPRGYHVRQRSTYWDLLGMQQSMLNDRGLQEGQGYNPAQELRFWEFMRSVEHKPIRYNAAAFRHPPPVALNLLQIQWAIGPAAQGPPVPGATVAGGTRAWKVFRLPGTPRRVSLFTSWQLEPSSMEALRDVTANGFDPNRTLLVEGRPGIRPVASPPAVAGAVSYRSLGPERCVVTVRTAVPAIVLVRNSFDAHWHATVDGRSAPVLPADEIDQAVPVPAGRHTVVLTYRDASIGFGMLGSAVALAALLGTAVWRRRRDRREAPARLL